jgi:hypothetical protein
MIQSELAHLQGHTPAPAAGAAVAARRIAAARVGVAAAVVVRAAAEVAWSVEAAAEEGQHQVGDHVPHARGFRTRAWYEIVEPNVWSCFI